MPFRPLQYLCGEMQCNLDYIDASRKRAEASQRTNERRLIREARQKAKPRSKWLKQVQAEFNKYCRLRDKDLGCVSCDKPATWIGQWHASHYRSVGACPELRFNELNVHKSCSVCNNFLSSNAIEYRIRLIPKIGLEKVEWLEGPHEPKKYTIEELIALKAHFKQLYKELQHASSE